MYWTHQTILIVMIRILRTLGLSPYKLIDGRLVKSQKYFGISVALQVSGVALKIVSLLLLFKPIKSVENFVKNVGTIASSMNLIIFWDFLFNCQTVLKLMRLCRNFKNQPAAPKFATKLNIIVFSCLYGLFIVNSCRVNISTTIMLFIYTNTTHVPTILLTLMLSIFMEALTFDLKCEISRLQQILLGSGDLADQKSPSIFNGFRKELNRIRRAKVYIVKIFETHVLIVISFTICQLAISIWRIMYVPTITWSFHGVPIFLFSYQAFLILNSQSDFQRTVSTTFCS